MESAVICAGLGGGCWKLLIPEAAEGTAIGNTWEEKKELFGELKGRTAGAGNEGMTQCPLGGREQSEMGSRPRSWASRILWWGSGVPRGALTPAPTAAATEGKNPSPVG